MAENDKSGAKPQAEEKPTAAELGNATAPKPEDEEVPTLTVERLLVDGEAALGYSSADVAGAFAGVPPSKEVTIKDAKDRVKKWLAAEVAPDPQSEQE